MFAHPGQRSVVLGGYHSAGELIYGHRLDRTVVLADLNFTVARGASLAVIGPNGSGKTVLFRALIGAIPYEGTIGGAPGTLFGYVPQKLDIERDLPITGFYIWRA